MTKRRPLLKGWKLYLVEILLAYPILLDVANAQGEEFQQPLALFLHGCLAERDCPLRWDCCGLYCCLNYLR
jgi:hypothetical protein